MVNREKNRDFQVIDLYGEHFEPAYTAEELKLFSSGKALDPKVKRYQKILKASDRLTFIFPIWWSNIPSIVKGFIDKTMIPGFAYDENDGWHGHLTWINHVNVLTTSEVSKTILRQSYGDPIQGLFIDVLLRDLGIDNSRVDWCHFGNMHSSSDQARQDYLNNLQDLE